MSEGNLQFNIPFAFTPWLYSPVSNNPGASLNDVCTKGMI